MASGFWYLEDGRGYARRMSGMVVMLEEILSVMRELEGAADFAGYLNRYIPTEAHEANGYGGIFHLETGENTQIEMDLREFRPENRELFWGAAQKRLDQLIAEGEEGKLWLVHMMKDLLDMRKRIRRGEDPMALNHLGVVVPPTGVLRGPGWGMESVEMKCKTCKGTHGYELRADAVVALEGEWRGKLDAETLMDRAPEAFDDCWLNLKGPLKIDLTEPFWCVYMAPLPFWNGLETEEEVKSIRFCLCKTLGMLPPTDSELKVEVRVLEVLDLDHKEALSPPDFHWLEILNSQSPNDRTFSATHFPSYSLLDVNVQSDLGVTAIVRKENGNAMVVAVNDWDFHRNLWYLCAETLDKEREERYGIRHFD